MFTARSVPDETLVRDTGRHVWYKHTKPPHFRFRPFVVLSSPENNRGFFALSTLTIDAAPSPTGTAARDGIGSYNPAVSSVATGCREVTEFCLQGS